MDNNINKESEKDNNNIVHQGLSMKDIDQMYLERAIQNASENHEDKKSLTISIILSIIGMLVLFLFHISVFGWNILIAIASSLLTLLFVYKNEKMNETKYFLKTWVIFAFATYLISFIVYLVLSLIIYFIFNIDIFV